MKCLKNTKKFKIKLVREMYSTGFILAPDIETCREVLQLEILNDKIDEGQQFELGEWEIQLIKEVLNEN